MTAFLYPFVIAWLAGWMLALREPRAAVPDRDPGIDFTITQTSRLNSVIRWRDGRVETVSPARLKTLKLTFLWVADLA